MANWYGTARSNYFRVKDKDAFLKWADGRGLGVFKNEESADLFAIHGGETPTMVHGPAMTWKAIRRSIWSPSLPSIFPKDRLPS